MIKNLKNPKDLIICLKFLIHLSLTDDESFKSINSIIRKHMGYIFEKNEDSVEKMPFIGYDLFSTRDTISPIPRILLASLSG